MTNGNDYLEIEERCIRQIQEDYFKDIIEGIEEIPDSYKFTWVSSYLEDD